MLRGSALFIIVFLILVGSIAYGAYYYYTNYSQTPPKITTDTANSIPKYPDAKTWQIIPTKNVCFMKGGDCSQPVTISFSGPKEWPIVYGYYKTTMQNYGWSTNSIIVTSIPTSVVFTKTFGKCSTTLAPKNGAYTFIVSCQDKSAK